MHRILVCLVPALLAVCLQTPVAADERVAASGPNRISVSPEDWPWWRGPRGNGTAAPGQRPPIRWSESENVLWKTTLAGRGHGSPAVVGDQVFLATAEQDPPRQSVLCFDRETGKQQWQTIVHRDGLSGKGNKKASLASATVACDGQRVFVNFLNDGAVYTSALSRAGELLWQTEITKYVVHQGYGSSPLPYRSLVLVSADNQAGGTVAGLDRVTGKIVWELPRPKTPNYASPIVLRAAGREQMLLTGCNLVTSVDPLSGSKLWEIEGATTECVTSAVTDGQLVFTSGGYPKNHVSAVRADGSGEVVWENKVRVYVPSMFVRDKHLYAVVDSGVAMCWECETGRQMWKGRLGGKFSASPVLVGDRIYATNEGGTTFIFKASPAAFELLASNQLGSEVMATPTICGERVYMRVAAFDGNHRQEVLVCLGHKN